VKKLGLIVNPVAGTGGRVGLKGSDGPDIQRRARELGALPESPRRAVDALKSLTALKDRIEVVTYPREMGEDAARECGFTPTVAGSIASAATTPEDTWRAAREMEDMGVHLVLFAGGDGTARDILDAVDRRITVLGIPAGVKVHSAVYAVTPRSAGMVARMFLEGRLDGVRDAEVMDIDEDAFRAGVVAARLYGYLRVPEERSHVQSAKSSGQQGESESLKAIAAGFAAEIDEDTLYVMGPGSTIAAIMSELGLDSTLLGVDAVRNGAVVAADAGERDLLGLISGHRAKIVVTVIGGQGYVLGRGNQQISPEVVRRVLGSGRENIVIVAAREKLAALRGRPLLVDTGDEDLDQTLAGYWKVMTGYREYAMYRVGV
jgi:predicted polyphosphate/ATP-dependent NAD kinase